MKDVETIPVEQTDVEIPIETVLAKELSGRGIDPTMVSKVKLESFFPFTISNQSWVDYLHAVGDDRQNRGFDWFPISLQLTISWTNNWAIVLESDQTFSGGPHNGHQQWWPS